MKEKLLSLLMVASMVLTMTASPVFAADELPDAGEEITLGETQQPDGEEEPTPPENGEENAKPTGCICETLCTEGGVNADCPVCAEDPSACIGEREKASESPANTIPTEGGQSCICETLCTEGSVNTDCPVCGAEGADLTQCLGKSAPDTEGGEAGGEPEQPDGVAETDPAVAEAQTMIDALPTAAELEGLSQDEQGAVYEQLQAAYDAYTALTKEQKEQITGAEVFDSLFGVFNGMASTLEEIAEGDFGGDLHWSLDDNGTLTIWGTGKMPDFGYYEAPWDKDKTKIKTVVIKDGVTSIGTNAFYGYLALTSVTIPESVTEIGDNAFQDCNNLISVTFPEGSELKTIGNSAFYYCSALNNISIPASVTSIGGEAFQGCSALTSITIPKGVTKIGDNAFRSCTSLVTVTFAENSTLKTIGGNAFNGCSSLTGVTIPKSVTEIGDSAFYGCKNLNTVAFEDGSGLQTIGDSAFEFSGLTSITIPEGVTTIGNHAFRYCTSLTGVTIPKSVTEIGDSAFQGCSALTGVTIPEDSKLETIGGSAFEDCSALTGVTIPKGVTTIKDNAFEDCSALTSVTIPEDSELKTIGNYAFDGCSDLASITIPKGVTTIGHHAFRYCKSLTGVTIPESVTGIGDSAFYECKSLNTVTFAGESRLETIGGSAFEGSGLTSITIPEGVKEIGTFAFNHCSSLTTIIFKGTTAPTLGDSVFDEALQAILIPKGAEGYMGGSWPDDKILPIGDKWGQLENSNLYWSCDEGSGTLTIWGRGDMPDFSSSRAQPWEEYQRKIKTVEVRSGVTSIGKEAFSDCSLTELTLPESVTKIGECAFRNCISLTTVDIPASVISIGAGAFSSSTLWSVTFPANSQLTTIGDSAFERCNSLTSIIIPASVETIGDSAFEDCTSLVSVNIPESVESIGENAFQESGLTSINIPASVTSIGNYAFESCSALTSVTIPTDSKLKTIGNYAFSNSGLTKIDIPESVTSIGEYAFESCSALTSVTIPTDSQLTTIGDSAFAESGLTEITIPAKVTEIGDYAFYDCTGLSMVTFADESQLTTIGDKAFWSCKNLTGITIPASVESIGKEAFLNCTDLSTVTFADESQLETIGEFAFEDCTSLKTIIFTGTIAPKLGNNSVFDEALEAIYVPKGATGYTTDNGWPDNIFLNAELKADSAVRSGEATATVTFTSDEAGTYYYMVVESEGQEPDFDKDTWKFGTCDNGKNTINLSNLTAGAKDIYIVVRDDVNVSQPLQITIPAYTPSGPGGSGDSGHTGGSSGSSSGGSSYRDREYDFWMAVKDRIEAADPGDTVKANAKGYDRMPWPAMEALRKTDGVTLHITWNGGEDIVIPSEAALSEQSRIYYPLSYLEGMTFDVEPEAPTHDPSKVNPETGGIWEVTAPAAADSIITSAGEPEVTAPQRGLAATPELAEKGIEQAIPGIHEPEEAVMATTEPETGFSTIWIAVAAALAAAAGGGIWYWQRRKQA